jgi:hypothetical protein
LLAFPDLVDWEVTPNVARAGSVPHSNQAVVSPPFGFRLPFKVAPVAVTDVAALVITSGARISRAANELPVSSGRSSSTAKAWMLAFLKNPIGFNPAMTGPYKESLQYVYNNKCCENFIFPGSEVCVVSSRTEMEDFLGSVVHWGTYL